MYYRNNPSIRLSKRFFENAIRDYYEWKEKWWREAIQNSVDAGSTVIECISKKNAENNTRTISCIDNGKGMDEDTLINKFLVLGETTKEDGGTIGGFGKAKELLILPWLSWEIHTRDTLVRGDGDHYEIEKVTNYLDGTRLTVVMDEDRTTNSLAAKSFIRKCSISGVTFIVNGEEILANLDPGELVEKTDNFHIYYNPEDQFAGRKVLIRIGGVYMFNDWAEKLEGTIVIETQGSSINIFTANREGFRDPTLKQEYKQFINKITKDIRSGLRGGSRVRKVYRGGKRFDPNVEGEMADDISYKVKELGLNRVKSQGTEKTVIGADSLEVLKRFVEAVKKQKEDHEELQKEIVEYETEERVDIKPPKILSDGLNAELTEALLKNVNITGPNHIESVSSQLVWEPDFFLVNEIKDFDVPEKFYPESMSNKVQRLARFWAELCRFTLIQLGCSKQFGVGFIFSYQTEWRRTQWSVAQYVREQGDHWLLFNPYRNGDPKGRLYNLSNEDDIDSLYAAAVHECTHMSDGVDYHDEDFAIAITSNMAKTFRGRRNLRAIRDAISVKAREEITKAVRTEIEKGRGFYQVYRPGVRGRVPKFRVLQEARDYIDKKYPDKRCRIDAYWWSFDDEPQKVGVVEYRIGKSSVNTAALPVDLDSSLRSIRYSWEDKYPNEAWRDSEEVFMRYNPRGLRRYNRNKWRRRYL